jgi:hypothetical protein
MVAAMHPYWPEYRLPVPFRINRHKDVSRQSSTATLLRCAAQCSTASNFAAHTRIKQHSGASSGN